MEKNKPYSKNQFGKTNSLEKHTLEKTTTACKKTKPSAQNNNTKPSVKRNNTKPRARRNTKPLGKKHRATCKNKS